MKRTILRSSKGKKLYAVRKANGRFADIQSYQKAHAADLRKTAKGEKRQRLVDYIVGFACEIHGSDDAAYKKAYNKAWDRLWKKIDRLNVV